MDKTKTAVILLIVILALMGVVIFALKDQIFGAKKEVKKVENQNSLSEESLI